MVYDIFVSKPNDLSSKQSAFVLKLEKIFETRDFKIRSIGTSDFPNEAPLLAVKNIMDSCKGAIILGLKQTHIIKGISKPNTNSERKITDISLPTAWNHIEAGIAFASKIPIMIIREGIREGVFDIGSSGRFIHQVNIELEGDEYFQSVKFLQPFNQFVTDVITFANN